MQVQLCHTLPISHVEDAGLSRRRQDCCRCRCDQTCAAGNVPVYELEGKCAGGRGEIRAGWPLACSVRRSVGAPLRILFCVSMNWPECFENDFEAAHPHPEVYQVGYVSCGFVSVLYV